MTQFGKHSLTVWADVNVGIGRIERNGLIRIEEERPTARSVLNAVERAGPF
jgi:hypothetical protein